MFDYHVHTKLCKHASGGIDEYLRGAIAAGVSEIAFTDHIPLPGDFDAAHRMAPNEMELYQEWIRKAQAAYPGITILFGIEADYYPGFEPYLESFLRRFDFDLVIMSVHFIHAWPPGNWVFNYDFPDKSKATVLSEYTDALISGMATGLFDVLGHADIIKRPGESLLQIIPEKTGQLLDAVKTAGMALEFNTSGQRKAVGEPYPEFSWLPLILERQIPITTGSDAHAPEQVALNFKAAYKTLINRGVRQLARYYRRRLTLSDL